LLLSGHSFEQVLLLLLSCSKIWFANKRKQAQKAMLVTHLSWLADSFIMTKFRPGLARQGMLFVKARAPCTQERA
jgi:hypothetical protein